MIIEHGYDVQDFVAGMQTFADETQRRSRPLFYEDVFGDFQQHAEDGAGIYTPEQVGGLLQDYAARPEQTVTVRCYEPEINLNDYDEHELPPHTAFTYVPGDADGTTGKIEINTIDETVRTLDDIVASFFPGLEDGA